MFSFFKRKRAPEGPVHFSFDVEIARPAAEVYALLDWADPLNAKRQLGESVARVPGDPNGFVMRLQDLPDHQIDIVVTEAVPHTSYSFASEFQPHIGRLLHSHERYLIEPRGPECCLVTLESETEFRPGLLYSEFEEELLMMSVACHNAVEKLRLHAEQGVDAVRAVADQVIVAA